MLCTYLRNYHHPSVLEFFFLWPSKKESFPFRYRFRIADPETRKKQKKSGHKATNVSLDDLKNFIDAHTSSTGSQCRKGFMSYQFNISYARRLELCMPRSEDQWALPQFKLRIVDELKFLWEVWYKMPCDDCLRYVFIEDWKILIWLWNITCESSNFKHSDPVDFFNRASVLQIHWHAFPYHKTHLPVCRDSKWFPFFSNVTSSRFLMFL